MVSISSLQKIKLEREIQNMPELDQVIARKILENWDSLVISSHDIMFSFLIPLVLSSTIAFMVILLTSHNLLSFVAMLLKPWVRAKQPLARPLQKNQSTKLLHHMLQPVSSCFCHLSV